MRAQTFFFVIATITLANALEAPMTIFVPDENKYSGWFFSANQQGFGISPNDTHSTCAITTLNPIIGVDNYSFVKGFAILTRISGSGPYTAFVPFNSSTPGRVEDAYLDGFSVVLLDLKSNTRHHLWSYAVSDVNLCPQGASNAPPSFVGSNFYCLESSGTVFNQQKLTFQTTIPKIPDNAWVLELRICLQNPSVQALFVTDLLMTAVVEGNGAPNSSNTVALAVGLSLALVFVILVVAVVAFVLFRKRIIFKGSQKDHNAAIEMNGTRIGSKSNFVFQKIDESDIILKEVLGTGNYGRVYRGEWEGSSVALKKLKGLQDETTQDDFVKELKTLSVADHMNLVRLYGVWIQGSEQYLVTEYCNRGALDSYLQSAVLSVAEKLDIMKQITRGLEALHQLQIIHRDLAARNILIHVENHLSIAKISDFGLSREIDHYYNAAPTSNFAIKWSSPEVLEYRKFSKGSDIWALGVLFWEILEDGAVPFSSLTNPEAIKYVLSGKRLEKPQSCPQSLYEIMQECWNSNPQQRIPLSSLLSKLDSLHQTLAEQQPQNTQKSVLGTKEQEDNNNVAVHLQSETQIPAFYE